MIFEIAFKKDGNYLIKAEFKAGEGSKWASTTEAVFNFAKKNFKKGDNVNIDYRTEKGKYFVDRITKVEGTTTTETKSETTTKTEQPKTETKTYYQKSPDVQDAIIRQSTLASACQAIQVLTGQVNDVQVLGDMIETLFDRFYKKVKM